MGAVFGRERELAAADAFLDRAAEGFAALLLAGEPGVGKTTVWGEVARRAEEERTFRLLRARASETEVKLAFAGLADLLAPVGADVLRALPGPQRLAIEVALLRASPRGAPTDPRALGTALLTVLVRLTDDGPLLVALDDAQWLDRPSAAALGFALRRVGPERPLGVLAAERVASRRSADVVGLARLAPAPAERLDLGALGATALHRLLAARLDIDLPRPMLARIEEVSGGNPLLALELARALRDAGGFAPGEPLPVPVGLDELLGRRLATLPAGEREALLAVALLARPTSGLVRRALDERSPGVVERLVDAGVLEVRGEQLRFGHPLYGAVVLGSALPERRHALHARLARLVDDPEERARHVALATTSPDEGVARLLEEAAGRARARGAWDAAGELLERAGELTPDGRPDAARRRALAAAAHHIRAGDRMHARALVEQILGQPAPRELRAEALRLLAEISYNDESFEDARRLFGRAIEEGAEGAERVIVGLGLAYVNSNLMDWATARRDAWEALERAERLGDAALVGQALGYCAMMDFLCGLGVDWTMVERALALEDADAAHTLVTRPSTLAAYLVLYVGRHAEAQEQLLALCASARERGDESDLGFVLLWLSWLETRCGDFARAVAHAEEAESIAAVTGSPAMRAWALTQQAWAHAHRGAAAETRRLCAAAREPVDRSGNRLPELWIAASLASLALSREDPVGAWRACEALTAALEQRGIGEPVPAFFLPDALEALIALGQHERADVLLRSFEERARTLDRTWALATGARCRGLLQAAGGDLVGGLESLEEALAQHERIDMPFERARTLLARGVVERRDGRRRSARNSLEEAAAEFERMGARLWVERATEELRRIPLRRAATTDGLTPAEERVAELVGRGVTNREAASRLFVSEKTVEANLTRIYRKLGVRSRAGLAARMGARDGGAEPAER